VAVIIPEVISHLGNPLVLIVTLTSHRRPTCSLASKFVRVCRFLGSICRSNSLLCVKVFLLLPVQGKGLNFWVIYGHSLLDFQPELVGIIVSSTTGLVQLILREFSNLGEELARDKLW